MGSETLFPQALRYTSSRHDDSGIGERPIEATETPAPARIIQIVLTGILFIDE
ncbi:hypothetical protein D3C77_783000 [compost metagenome]